MVNKALHISSAGLPFEFHVCATPESVGQALGQRQQGTVPLGWVLALEETGTWDWPTQEQLQAASTVLPRWGVSQRKEAQHSLSRRQSHLADEQPRALEVLSLHWQWCCFKTIDPVFCSMGSWGLDVQWRVRGHLCLLAEVWTSPVVHVQAHKALSPLVH